jgi:hypothetical protein
MSKYFLLVTLLSILSIIKNANLNLRNTNANKKETITGSGDILNIKNMTPSNNQNYSPPAAPKSVNIVETKKPEHKDLELVINNIPKSFDGKIISPYNQVSVNQLNKNNFRTETQLQSQAKFNYENNKLLTEKMKYENVHIIDSHSVPNKSPEYIKKEENNEMKTAILINNKDKNMENNTGLTERPNYLSSVIHPHATSVLTPNRLYTRDANTPTYDLESIKKRHYFELMAKGSNNENPNLMNFGGDNMIDNVNAMTINMSKVMPPNSIPFPNAGDILNKIRNSQSNMNPNMNAMSNNNYMPYNYATQIPNLTPHLNPNVLPLPIPINIPSTSPMGISIPPGTMINDFNSLNNPNGGVPLPSLANHFMNPPMTTKLVANNISDEQHFNMKVSYKGQVMHNNPIIPDLNQIEKKIQNLDKLSEQELNEGKKLQKKLNFKMLFLVISQMKSYEENLSQMNSEIYKNIKKYEAQNNVILDSLKDEISDANNQLGSMIVEVPLDQRQIINREIEEEFSKSLAGYNINKAKFAHLKDLDPKEMFDISARIKKELDSNDNFYLHGDYNFY